ncbi:hypothetical protein O181_005757 [Austropuccinia psidii MF-1]|uniref:Uncharacterized protein n=1 Tax=Austropuccinia psidii MF-1 TaxID=1389203 RepID=A0A9Q3BIQ5_9BASI|nr:hypothetical protein [Austropuccinia psidii MF-1]
MSEVDTKIAAFDVVRSHDASRKHPSSLPTGGQTRSWLAPMSKAALKQLATDNLKHYFPEYTPRARPSRRHLGCGRAECCCHQPRSTSTQCNSVWPKWDNSENRVE